MRKVDPGVDGGPWPVRRERVKNWKSDRTDVDGATSTRPASSFRKTTSVKAHPPASVTDFTPSKEPQTVDSGPWPKNPTKKIFCGGVGVDGTGKPCP